jgi:fused signal recognition particle receptor
MFSFFKKKSPPIEPVASALPLLEETAPPPETERRGWLDRLRGVPAEDDATAKIAPVAPVADVSSPAQVGGGSDGFARAPHAVGEPATTPLAASVSSCASLASTASPDSPSPIAESDRRGWIDKLRGGLRKTGSSITQVFTGTKIDEALYEELESALLMADAGVKATELLLDDLKRRVKQAKATDPRAVKGLLADSIAELLAPLERGLRVGEHVPTVIMVVGVNGAGKTTSIGKLTRHLAESQQKVLLAAADTFRAAAREQLAVWAGRNGVEIVGQQGGDPAAVTFDAVVAAKARGCDVVIADTAGRLTTQVHLMDELKKIRRVIAKAQEGAPHEVLLVVDGNTGQNALTQVQAFDAALQLTGLIITKLDGTAKGGVVAAIALWSRERARDGGSNLPVYFIGVGEKLEDLQTFSAREFAQALLS